MAQEVDGSVPPAVSFLASCKQLDLTLAALTGEQQTFAQEMCWCFIKICCI